MAVYLKEIIPDSFYSEHLITKNLTPEQREDITSKIEGFIGMYPNSPFILSENLRGSSPFRGDGLNISSYHNLSLWGNSLYDKWPLIALKAFHDKSITRNQLATVCLFAEAVHEFIKERRFYCIENTPNRADYHLILPKYPENRAITVLYPSDEEYNKYLNIFFRGWAKPVHQKELQDRISEITELSEKAIFVIPAPSGSIEYWSSMLKAISVATQRRLYPFFEVGLNLITGEADERKLVLPSFSLIEIYIKYLNASNQIEAIPRFGAMTREEIITDRFNFSHVVALSISGAELPDKADGRYVGPFSYSGHDIYHSFRLGEVHPFVLIGINRLLQLFSKITTKGKVIEELKDKLTDSEFTNIDDDYKFGTVFSASFMKPLWDAKEEKYKKLALEEMARHRSFWDKILKETRGLYPEEEESLKLLQKSIQEEELPIDSLTELFPFIEKLISYKASFINPLSVQEILALSLIQARRSIPFTSIFKVLDNLERENLERVITMSEVEKLLDHNFSYAVLTDDQGARLAGVLKYILSSGEQGWEFLKFISENRSEVFAHYIVRENLVEKYLLLKDLFKKGLILAGSYTLRFLTFLEKNRENSALFPITEEDLDLESFLSFEDISKGTAFFLFYSENNPRIIGDFYNDEDNQVITEYLIESKKRGISLNEVNQSVIEGSLLRKAKDFKELIFKALYESRP